MQETIKEIGAAATAAHILFDTKRGAVGFGRAKAPIQLSLVYVRTFVFVLMHKINQLIYSFININHKITNRFEDQTKVFFNDHNLLIYHLAPSTSQVVLKISSSSSSFNQK